MTLMTKFDELLAEGMEQGLAKGLAKGRSEGLRQGKMEGEIRFARLTEILLSEGKLDDLQRAVTDPQFREQLYLNYKL